MRRSGQTTRLIDDAIQSLFTEGELYLFRKGGFSKARSVLKDKYFFVDPDQKGNARAQEDFIYRVGKRLETEHKGTYTVNMQHSKDYIHLKVKNK